MARARRARTTSRSRPATPLEVAERPGEAVQLPDGSTPPRGRHPGLTTVAEVAQNQHVAAGTLLKAYPVIVDDRGLVIVVVRGDHRSTRSSSPTPWRDSGPPARMSSRSASARPATSVRSGSTCRSCSTTRSSPAPTSRAPTARTRTSRASSPAATSRSSAATSAASSRRHGRRQEIRIEPAIEVGTSSSSEPSSRSPSAPRPRSVRQGPPIWIGSYGIGPARITATAVEQYSTSRHLMAQPDRAVRHPPGRPRQGRQRGARARPPALRGPPRRTRLPQPRRRPRRRPAGQVRRRRAARRYWAILRICHKYIKFDDAFRRCWLNLRIIA